MKFRYNIKSISNNIFKKIVRNIGFNIDRISDLQLKINKIKLIKNKVKKYSEVKTIAKKYPKDPRVQLFLAETMYDNWDVNYFEQINIYANSRMNWLKATGLDEVNIEFISPNVVAGSLGNYWPLEGLIHANEYKLRPAKNIYLLCRSYLLSLILSCWTKLGIHSKSTPFFPKGKHVPVGKVKRVSSNCKLDIISLSLITRK